MKVSYTYINNINGLRFILFNLIFIHHIYLIYQNSLSLPLGLNSVFHQMGNFAVTFFFILSGFCVYIGYEQKFITLKKQNIFKFLKKRFVKLYPLYIITGIICLIYFIYRYSIIKILVFPFYVFMLQPWTTHITCAGNSAAWFIATLFFCYMLSPFTIYFINKQNKTILYYFLLLLFLACLSIILILNGTSKEIYLYLYHFPLLRFLQYAIGLFLGKIYLTNQLHTCKINNISETKLFIFELIILILMYFSIYFKSQSSEGTFIKTQILYIPLISIFLLYIANIKKGVLNYIFTLPIFLSLGTITFQLYLIHYTIISIFYNATSYNKSILQILFYSILVYIFTIILSYTYKYFDNNPKGDSKC